MHEQKRRKTLCSYLRTVLKSSHVVVTVLSLAHSRICRRATSGDRPIRMDRPVSVRMQWIYVLDYSPSCPARSRSGTWTRRHRTRQMCHVASFGTLAASSLGSGRPGSCQQPTGLREKKAWEFFIRPGATSVPYLCGARLKMASASALLPPSVRSTTHGTMRKERKRNKIHSQWVSPWTWTATNSIPLRLFSMETSR